jgi:Family of unknown function (DUF6328)
MSSDSDDDPILRSSSERYDRVGVSFRWPQILASASSIFFGFLLSIEVSPPSYFSAIDYEILLAALYSAAVATAMFVMPVIYHMSHYRKFDVDRFLFSLKQYVLTGIICIMLAMYLSLGLVLDSKLQIQIAYGLASFPFICIVYELLRKASTNPIKSTSTERYDRMGAAMRWCQILASSSSIFFGFLLNITIDRPSHFSFFDNSILLAALYAVTIATTMFFTPVIYHARHYRKLDVEEFLFWTTKPVRFGILCVVLAMYLGLALALASAIPDLFAYSLASLPFILIYFEYFRIKTEFSKISFKN